MDIRIHARHVDMPLPLAGEIERRLRFAFRRFTGRITTVVLRLSDLNGPRGGTDKDCGVTVTFSKGGTAQYRAIASQTAVAVSRAVAGLRTVVARRLAVRCDGPRQGRRRCLMPTRASMAD